MTAGLLSALGGVGLFLFGMTLLTEGLRNLAGLGRRGKPPPNCNPVLGLDQGKYRRHLELRSTVVIRFLPTM